jgi:hypothetical protein
MLWDRFGAPQEVGRSGRPSGSDRQGPNGADGRGGHRGLTEGADIESWTARLLDGGRGAGLGSPDEHGPTTVGQRYSMRSTARVSGAVAS